MTSTVITEQDVALYKPQTDGDFPESGGSITSTKIDPDKADEIFADLTEYGRVDNETAIRKVFVAVDSDDAATYRRAHVMLTKIPADPAVHVTLTTTGDHHDTRADIQGYIEQAGYIAGSEARWVLMGNHVAGMQSVKLFSLSNAANATTPVADARPEPNDVLVLSVEGAGYTPHAQYFRVGSVLTDSVQQFTDDKGDFYKSVIIVSLSQRLDQNYIGVDTVQRVTAFSRPTVVRATQYADALDAKGLKPLAVDAASGAGSVRIDSPYGILVPSSTTETPVVDQPAIATVPTYVQAGAAGSLSASATLAGEGSDHAATLYFGGPCLPGSLALSIGGAAHTDDGHGGLTGPAGTLFAGTVDYPAGEVRITASAAWTRAVSGTATPAAVVQAAAYSKSVKVTSSNQALNWVSILSPVPAPLSLTVQYRAAKRWYTLADNGKGGLVGAAGGGSDDYASGSAIVTAGALPDIGSALLYQWGSPVRATNRAGSSFAVLPEMDIDLAQAPIPGSYTVTWTSNGATKSATANAAGVLSGDATGTLSAAGKKLRLKPTALPDPGTQFGSAYSYGTPSSETFHPILGAGTTAGQFIVGAAMSDGTVGGSGTGVGAGYGSWEKSWIFSGWNVVGRISVGDIVDATTRSTTLTLADTPVAGTLRIRYPLGHVRVTGNASGSTAELVELRDDGTGGLKIVAGPGVDVGATLAGATVNYGAKTVTFAPVLPKFGTAKAVSHNWTTGADTTLTFQNPYVWQEGSPLTVEYLASSTPAGSVSGETAAVPPVALNLAPGIADAAAPGSVRFTFGGSVYVDREGLLYRAISPTTGSGTPAGSIDYTANRATLTDWAPGASGSATVTALVTINGAITATDIYGRVAGAPLSVGQFPVRATGADGTVVLLTADTGGTVSGTWGRGAIDWTTGVWELHFGRYLASDDALWFASPVAFADAAHHPSDSTLRWRPLAVMPSTVRYDAVNLSYLPVSSARLGVQAERLPADGKVLQFRPGDVCVVFRDETVTLPNPLIADTVYDLGEERISRVKLFDQHGTAVPATEWSAEASDLDAGQVRTAPSITLSGLVQPIVAKYRIEDVVKLGDHVDISGLLGFSPGLTHDYPAANSFIASTLFAGDIQARIPILFEQAAWTPGDWQDVRVGSAPLAQFDAAAFPILVKNYPAKTERLAFLFTGTTTFDCYGEYSGLIGSGNITTDFYVRDRATNAWYLKMPWQGWGGGWGAGKLLRLNFEAAAFPLVLIRAALAGSAAVVDEDSIGIEIRGYSNRST